MMPYSIDIDGNFVEEFQSVRFDSRLWELYLNAYLTEEQLFINHAHNAHDFIVTKYGKSIAIEAVIVGRRENHPPQFFKNYNAPRICFTTQTAVCPVPEELFPSIAHHRYEDSRIASRVPEFHPFASMTLNIRIEK